MSSAAAGTLYLVATPIGNLEDITHRALRVLAEVDRIACEDTRHSRVLLDHYGIRKPLVAYYRERERERGAELLAGLLAGENIALISDAGTPLVSDPGAHLVREAVAAGITVVPIPGASAAMTALMGAGVDGPVVLLGFPPARSGERRRMLEPWLTQPAAPTAWLVLYEAPHRLRATLDDLCDLAGPERPLIAARELTKLHEEWLRGTAASMRAHFAEHPPRGEFTLLVGPAPATAAADAAPTTAAGPRLTKAEFKTWAREQGLARDAAFRRLQQLRGTLTD